MVSIHEANFVKKGEDKHEGGRETPRILDLFSMETASPRFVDEIIRGVGEQKPEICYECIKCTSGCTAARLSKMELMPHQIVKLLRLGFRDRIINLKVIWNCTNCNYCSEICPQNVFPADIIRSIRRIAVGLGNILENHRRVSKFLIETGHLVPINEEYEALRKDLDLSPKPPTTHVYSKALNEIRRIIEVTGFDKLVEGSA